MKTCSYCGTANAPATTSCTSCGMDEFRNLSGTPDPELAVASKPNVESWEALSEPVTVFRILLVVSTVSYLLGFFHIYFVSDHLVAPLSWHGYGAIFTLPTSVVWLSLALWLASALGMWLFVRSARFLYAALTLFFVLVTFFSGVAVQTGFGAFFGVVTNLSDGALLAIAFLSPVKERFR